MILVQISERLFVNFDLIDSILIPSEEDLKKNLSEEYDTRCKLWIGEWSTFVEPEYTEGFKAVCRLNTMKTSMYISQDKAIQRVIKNEETEGTSTKKSLSELYPKLQP